MRNDRKCTGPLEVMGDKNEVQFSKNLREEYNLPLCLLAKPLAGTNRNLSWNKTVMQELIMTILKNLYHI